MRASITNPEEIESNAKGIVGDEIKTSQMTFYLSWIIYFLPVSKQDEILMADTYKFQKKCCEDQFKFNQKVTLTLKETEATLESKDAGALKTKQKISEGIELINYTQKLVKMADSSEHGRKVVYL